MRVSGGLYRSRHLAGPKKNMPLRPTPDALRERAFAILGDAITDTVFLDLFSGTGAVGIEALSRGARQVYFVENHRASMALIQKNLKSLDISAPHALTVRRTADQALRMLTRREIHIDFLWADPPFPQWELGLLAVQEARSILRIGGRAFLECPDKAVIPEPPEGFELMREIKTGASRLLIFLRNEGAAND